MGRPLKGYEKNVCILTKPAVQALIQVQDYLDQSYTGLHLKIFDSYRPQVAVDDIRKWATDPSDQKMKKLYFPDHDKENLIELGYIAGEHSTHTRGSTVDMTLCRKQDDVCKELDMGSKFDYFSQMSHTNYNDISQEAIKNRKLLLDVMAKFGFINYHLEWWHFTLKDEPYPDTYFNFPVK